MSLGRDGDREIENFGQSSSYEPGSSTAYLADLRAGLNRHDSLASRTSQGDSQGDYSQHTRDNMQVSVDEPFRKAHRCAPIHIQTHTLYYHLKSLCSAWVWYN